MRKSKADTARTRERIVETASKQFRRHGISDAGLSRLMAAAGLTHGGFYRHFASKDQLVAEACHAALLSLTDGLAARIAGKSPDRALPLLLEKYLSRAHRDQPAAGCLLAALGSELARSDAATRDAATDGLLRLAGLIARQLKTLPPDEAQSRSLAIAAAMVGAITLSRILTDAPTSNALLRATKNYILKAASK
ncbi:MAG TPA: TetR family transcriptional regulator [Verrucomicrobiae bacterium]|nr:TetR family transcriptional regulator [Verrucomicrobiae bacterium]